jgi:hypothetical protein
MLPVLPRLTDIWEMVEGKFYFVLHAPRQSGKTTFLKTLTSDINNKGRMYALYCSLEVLDNIEDIHLAMSTVVSQILYQLEMSEIDAFMRFASDYRPDPEPRFDTAVLRVLNGLSVSLDKDLVVLFDEADSLSAGPLIPFLRQIRIGYSNRNDSQKTRFPRSLALIGMRDIRDYLVQVRPDGESRGLASPFNIKKESMTLANFTLREIKTLYGKHTKATGQVFEQSAIKRAWAWSEGQPWLVNALADRVVSEILKKDPSAAITGDHMDQAAETLIRRRDNHLDSLLNRLKEARVKLVVQSILLGDVNIPKEASDDDRRYVLDLGLVKDNGSGNLAAANPIYQEIILRFLTSRHERLFMNMPSLTTSNRWVDGDKLDMTALIKAFQEYWRENSGVLDDPNGYDEAVALLVLNAFLQRLLNGGVELLRREYALGRRRLDILARFKGVAYPVEVKIIHHQGLEDSLEQIRDYMGMCCAKEGWLVIFDHESKKPWEEKISWETRQIKGATVHLVGC